MKNDQTGSGGTGKDIGDGLDNKVIPVMREAVATVQVVLFGQLKEKLAERYTEMSQDEYPRLIGCIVNDMFGSPARDKESIEFARSHFDDIEKEMWAIKDHVPELIPLLTDALRMQTLCDNAEGVNSLPTLLRAREFGFLQEERTMPMPSTFMMAVRQLGTEQGLLKPMQMEDPSGG